MIRHGIAGLVVLLLGLTAVSPVHGQSCSISVMAVSGSNVTFKITGTPPSSSFTSAFLTLSSDVPLFAGIAPVQQGAATATATTTVSSTVTLNGSCQFLPFQTVTTLTTNTNIVYCGATATLTAVIPITPAFVNAAPYTYPPLGAAFAQLLPQTRQSKPEPHVVPIIPNVSGSVTFYKNANGSATAIGQVPVETPNSDLTLVAMLSIPQSQLSSPPAINNFTAVFTSGDPTNLSNSPVSNSVSVTAYPPLVLTAAPQSPSPSTYGQLVTFATTPAPPTLIFTDTYKGNTANISNPTAGLLGGTHTIVASYPIPGEVPSVCQSNPLPYQVNQATPTITLQTPSTACYANATVTATASNPSSVSTEVLPPTGSITFSTDAVPPSTPTQVNLAPGTSSTTETAVYTVNGITKPTTVTARYSGDTNYTTASATTSITPTAATLNLTPSSTATSYGIGVNFTAALSSAIPGGTTVTLTDTCTAAGGSCSDAPSTLPSVSLSGGTGQSSPQVYNLAVGTHTITAQYGGGSPASCGNTATATVNVTKAQSQTGLTIVGKNPAVACVDPISLLSTVSAKTPISPAALGVAQPSQTVTFADILQDGSQQQITANPGATLSPNSSALQASFAGDSRYLASSAQSPLTVTIPKLLLSLSSNSNTVTVPYGQSVVVTATLSANPGSNVVVTFFDGTTMLSPVQVSNTGIATFTLNPQSGTHTITATSTWICSAVQTITSANSVTITVNKIQTTLALAGPGNSTACQPTVLTATVSPATSTGTVVFYDVTAGRKTIAANVISNGSASTTVASAGPGAHQYEADYTPGDSNYTASTATASVTIGQIPSAISLSVQPRTTTPGQPVTLSANIPACQGLGSQSPPVTGTVVFSDAISGAPVQLNSTSVSGGAASFTTSSLTTGNHPLTAVYSGDTNYLPSTSVAVTESVGVPPPTATTVSLSSSSTSLNYGQPVTFIATLNPVGATGSVILTELNGISLSMTVNNGQAVFAVSNLSAGSHPFTATYNPDDPTKFSSSQASNTVTIVVTPLNTSVTLTAAPSTVELGQTISLTGTVTPSSATGMVTFTDGATALGAIQLSGGQAALKNVSLTEAGQHTLLASYTPDTANYLASSATGIVNVTSAPVPVKITVPTLNQNGPTSLDNATATQPYTFTFMASGGTSPYAWTAVTALPGNLTVSKDGVLSGVVPTPGTYTFTVQVQDSATPAGAPVQAIFSLSVLYPPLPSGIQLTVDNANPIPELTQPALTLTMPQAYPFTIQGTVTLTFAPNSTVIPTGVPASGYNPPDMGFSTPCGPGSNPAPNCPRAINVTILPTDTKISVSMIAVGTVAGSITATLGPLTPSGATQALSFPGGSTPSSSMTVGLLVPGGLSNQQCIIDSATAFHIQVDGYSTPRDLKSANLVFHPAPGKSLDTSSYTDSSILPGAATGFFSSSAATRGGEFSVVINGSAQDTSALGTVDVVLANSVGPSQTVSTPACHR